MKTNTSHLLMRPQDRTQMRAESTLTPALSHPMGEGERKTRLVQLRRSGLRAVTMTSLSRRTGEARVRVMRQRVRELEREWIESQCYRIDP